MTPFSRIEAARSASSFSSKSRRGWFGLARIRSIGTLSVGAGRAATAAGASSIVATSASSAERPRPRPLRSMPPPPITPVRPSPRPAHPGQQLARQPLVGEAAAAGAVVDQRRDRVRRRLAEPDVARDHRVVDQRAQVVPHVGGDLSGQVIASVVHGQHNTLYPEPRIGVGADRLHRAHQLRQALEREELALQRHQHRVRGDERVDRQEVERRRAVDQDEVLVPNLGAGRWQAPAASCGAAAGRTPCRRPLS